MMENGRVSCKICFGGGPRFRFVGVAGRFAFRPGSSLFGLTKGASETMSMYWTNPVGSLGRVTRAAVMTVTCVGLVVGFWAAQGRAEVLVDEAWADGSRAENKLPSEAAVWIGREKDVTVSEGVLSTIVGTKSQKMWLYFTADEPVTLVTGQTLTAAISFIPRGALYENTSRNFRVGLFYDADSPRVEADTNADSGGEGEPWANATGYAVQLLLTNDPYTGTASFVVGKRIAKAHPNLLGTTADYTRTPGGARISEELDKEYTLQLAVKRVSDDQVDVTAALYEGEKKLSSTTMHDYGAQFGGDAPICDKFDLLYLRLSDNFTTADQIDFTGIKVTLEP